MSMTKMGNVPDTTNIYYRNNSIDRIYYKNNIVWDGEPPQRNDWHTNQYFSTPWSSIFHPYNEWVDTGMTCTSGGYTAGIMNAPGDITVKGSSVRSWLAGTSSPWDIYNLSDSQTSDFPTLTTYLSSVPSNGNPRTINGRINGRTSGGLYTTSRTNNAWFNLVQFYRGTQDDYKDTISEMGRHCTTGLRVSFTVNMRYPANASSEAWRWYVGPVPANDGYIWGDDSTYIEHRYAGSRNVTVSKTAIIPKSFFNQSSTGKSSILFCIEVVGWKKSMTTAQVTGGEAVWDANGGSMFQIVITNIEEV